jgi:hypothetical protein
VLASIQLIASLILATSLGAMQSSDTSSDMGHLVSVRGSREMRVFKVSEFTTDVPLDEIPSEFDGEAITRSPDQMAELALAFSRTEVYGTCTETVEPRWLLQLLDSSGKILHTVAWSDLSTCALVDDKKYSIAPSFASYIKRSYGFLINEEMHRFGAWPP